MSQERFPMVPSSGEVARPPEVLLDEASAVLPADFPTSAGEVLVALDVNGAILTAAGATPRTFEGIHGPAVAGAQVFITPGRVLEDAIPVLGTPEFMDGWALCNNGATLVCMGGGEYGTVEEHTFVPGPILEEIAAAVPDSVLASIPYPDILLSVPFPDSEVEGSDHRIVSMEELASTPIPKIIVRTVEMDRKESGRILSSLDVPYTHEVSIDWTLWAGTEPLGVIKASGLESLYQRLGLPACGTVVIEDDTNGITMIEWAAFGVAMGGASEEIRAHANHATVAADNDDIAAVIHAIVRRCGGVSRQASHP